MPLELVPQGGEASPNQMTPEQMKARSAAILDELNKLEAFVKKGLGKIQGNFLVRDSGDLAEVMARIELAQRKIDHLSKERAELFEKMIQPQTSNDWSGSLAPNKETEPTDPWKDLPDRGKRTA